MSVKTDELLAALEQYLRTAAPSSGRVHGIEFLAWAKVPERERTRPLQMWVARRLRAAGFFPVSVRVGDRVMRLWRAPRGINWEALRTLDKPLPQDPVERGEFMHERLANWMDRVRWPASRLAAEMRIPTERVRLWLSGDRPIPQFAMDALETYELRIAKRNEERERLLQLTQSNDNEAI